MSASTGVGQGTRLAVDGGTPVRTTSFPERRLFGEEEKAAAVALFDEAIRTGKENAFGYGGAEEEAYCREFAAWLMGGEGGFADAVNSGSSAVYVALRALGLEPFSEVIVPALTDPGGIMPVPMMNCIPIVADARPGSYNVGPEQVEAALSPRTSAILVAHVAGEPVEMEPILDLARVRGIPVVEDCAQAHGATYKGKKVGTLGDIAAFSTMSGKHHATGAQGGVVFTRREELYWAARRAADRGKPFGLSGAQVAASSAASVVANTEASLNLNSSDLACAIGRVQLKKLPETVAARQRVAAAIRDGLAKRSKAVRPGWMPEGSEGSYWFMRLSVDARRLKVGASDFARALAKEGIPVAARYDGAMQGTAAWLNERRVFGSSGYPWRAPEYTARGGDPERRFACPNAAAVLESDFNLRIHERWGDEEIEDTVRAIEKVEGAYAR